MPKLLLVTVTKTEAQAVLKVFSEATGKPWQRQHIGDKTYYALGALGGADVFMVQSEMGAGTPGGALITIHNAITALAPAAIIMLGIAFGIRPEKQQMGEILVSKQIMAYEPQKRKGEQIIPRGDRVTCPTRLLSKFRDGDNDWMGAKVWFGLVLSGEKLVADAAFRDQLLALEPEAIGGEMEGAGLYTAASVTKTDWILVKAICDWADEQKHDDVQALAAKNAADFVRHVIGLGGWAATPHSSATQNDSGAITQGNNNVTLGAGSIYVVGDVGGDMVTGQKTTHSQAQASTTKSQVTPRALEMARRALDILEEQAAGYTTLTIPAHLRLELEDKRRQVAEFEKSRSAQA